MNRHLVLPIEGMALLRDQKGHGDDHSALFADKSSEDETPPAGILLKIQERKRGLRARELHDSAGPLLLSLHLGIAHLKTLDSGNERSAIIEEIQETVAQIEQTVRSIDFLCVP